MENTKKCQIIQESYLFVNVKSRKNDKQHNTKNVTACTCFHFICKLQFITKRQIMANIFKKKKSNKTRQIMQK